MNQKPKYLIHIAESLLHPGEFFIFRQTQEGAEKEKQFTEDGSALHKWRESIKMGRALRRWERNDS